MEIILVRHAQSRFNIGLTNNLDSEITDRGHFQAHQTGKYLAENYDLTGFQGIVSPFQRTLQTAHIIQMYNKQLPFRVDCDVRELLLYDFVNMPKRSLDGSPVVAVDLPNRKYQYNWFDWSGWSQPMMPMYMEDMCDCEQRLRGFLERLDGEKYLIVSHASPLQTLHDLIMKGRVDAEGAFDNGSYLGHELVNCSITRICRGNCEEFATVCHLEA